MINTAREYVPIFFDWLDTTQDLTADEKGNLIDAVVSYAAGKEYDQLLSGGCRIAFRFLKGQVDRNTELSGIRAKAADASHCKRQQSSANACKALQNSANVSKPEQTSAKSPKEKEKEKEKENDKDKERENTKPAQARSARFDTFWAAYPRHEAKQAAQKAFNKLNPDDALMERIIGAIESWKKTQQWQEDGGKYIPHPATWLNQRRWEDDIPKQTAAQSRPARTVTAQQYEQRDYSGQDDDLLTVMSILQGDMRQGGDAG